MIRWRRADNRRACAGKPGGRARAGRNGCGLRDYLPLQALWVAAATIGADAAASSASTTHYITANAQRRPMLLLDFHSNCTGPHVVDLNSIVDPAFPVA